MITLKAHYDGKTIVPDEPLDLPANQKLQISIEPIDPTDTMPAEPPRKADLSKLLGLGLTGPINPNPLPRRRLDLGRDNRQLP